MAKSGMPEGVKTVLLWGIGIASLALILLITGIIFGNLSDNMGFRQDSTTFYNETITLNGSAIPSTAQNRIDGSLSSVIITNSSSGTTLDANNYSIDGVKVINKTGIYIGQSVNVSGIVYYDSESEINTEGIISNYTTSTVNTAKQFPTTGTILGIALLLTILIGILIYAVKRMMSVASGTGSSGFGEGRSSSKFRGSSNSDFG